MKEMNEFKQKDPEVMRAVARARIDCRPVDYHRNLHPDLDRWHVYVRGAGHAIVVVRNPFNYDVEPTLRPIPVCRVEESGWEIFTHPDWGRVVVVPSHVHDVGDASDWEPVEITDRIDELTFVAEGLAMTEEQAARRLEEFERGTERFLTRWS
jgi:hypothetical protein